MACFPLDDYTADRILAGSIAPGDAPPGFEDAAALIRAGQGAASPDELADPNAVVTTLSAMLRSDAQLRPAGRRRGRRVRRVLVPPAVVAALAALGATAAGAATGSLPSPVQSMAASVASHAGVTLPNPDEAHHPDVEAGQSTETKGTTPATATGSGAGPADRARAGLCHAYWSGRGATTGNKAGATAFADLARAAAAAHQSLQQYCNAATRATTPGATPTTTSPGRQGISPHAPDTSPAVVPSGSGSSHGNANPANANPGNGNSGSAGNVDHGGAGNGNGNGTKGSTAHGGGPVAPSPGKDPGATGAKGGNSNPAAQGGNSAGRP